MKKKIFINMCLLALATVLLSIGLTAFVMYDSHSAAMKQNLRNEADFLAAGIKNGGEQYLSVIPADVGARITLVDTDGKVLFDNRASVGEMDNHLSRPEIVQAIELGRSETFRRSETIGQQTYYIAVRLDSEKILRVSATTKSVWAAVGEGVPEIFIIAAAVLVIAMVTAKHLTQAVIKPINELDLENPEENTAYDELSPLLVRISKQNKKIEGQMNELRTKQQQFEAITDNMSEGLAVLDSHGRILSVNNSALRLISTSNADCIGKHITYLNRNSAVTEAADKALSGGFGEAIIKANGIDCQLRASTVMRQNEVIGAVVIVLDVTEKQKAEQQRKEFTANVSHELKTPLTAISGYAELIMNSMTVADDTPRFAGRIYDEAKRLISLVEDIIKLSQLDENNISLEFEQVDLYKTAVNVQKRLDHVAKAGGITINVSGEGAEINGIPKMIEELVFNLCDNAVKYNKKCGRVDVAVKKLNDCVQFTVKDTGDGIPEEYRERVFERFFRVDKSHSKQTGGTGLGLSIVKHIALCHNAEISLESEVGAGTKITVKFPVQ